MKGGDGLDVTLGLLVGVGLSLADEIGHSPGRTEGPAPCANAQEQSDRFPQRKGKTKTRGHQVLSTLRKAGFVRLGSLMPMPIGTGTGSPPCNLGHP